MAASKKNNDKKKNVVVVRGDGLKSKVVAKSASQARSRAAKKGTPVGPTKGYGQYYNNKAKVQSDTVIYSRGGTGKGTTGKRAVVTEVKTLNTGRPDKRTTTTSRKLYQPKSRGNQPGPWDDISRAAGAVKRTVYSNPGNRNKASNVDKWLKGGNYQQREISSMPGDIAKGAKVLGRGVKTGAKAYAKYATHPEKWVGTKAVKAVAKAATKPVQPVKTRRTRATSTKKK